MAARRRDECPVAVMLVLASMVAAGHAAAASRCPSTDELAELSRSVGTGPDNERRIYTYFGERFGRPATLSQRGGEAEMTYATSGGPIRISLRRNAATGMVEITCR